MNMPLREIATAFAALCALTVALAGQPKVGEAFPSLADFKLEGALPDLKDKVVIVDFWASWCGPCKASFPALKEIHEKYSGQGLVIVAVSLDEDKGDMEGFLKKAKVPFIILRDAKGKLAEKLAIESIPTTFILGRDGKVRSLHSGYGGEATKRDYSAAVEKLLKN